MVKLPAPPGPHCKTGTLSALLWRQITGIRQLSPWLSNDCTADRIVSPGPAVQTGLPGFSPPLVPNLPGKLVPFPFFDWGLIRIPIQTSSAACQLMWLTVSARGRELLEIIKPNGAT